MKQRRLSETRFDRRPKATKRQRFLSEMDAVIARASLMVLVNLVQTKRSGKVDRRVLPQFPDTSKKAENGRKECLCPREGSSALSSLNREFICIDSGADGQPDESAILRFRPLLEQHKMASAMLQIINELLRTRRVRP